MYLRSMIGQENRLTLVSYLSSLLSQLATKFKERTAFRPFSGFLPFLNNEISNGREQIKSSASCFLLGQKEDGDGRGHGRDRLVWEAWEKRTTPTESAEGLLPIQDFPSRLKYVLEINNILFW